MTFITTQLDLPIAMGYSIPQVPLTERPDWMDDVSDVLNKEKLFGDVRYSRDFSTRTRVDHPEIGVKDFEEPERAEPPAETVSDFVEFGKSLDFASTEMSCESSGQIQTCTAPNRDHPDCSRADAACAYFQMDLLTNRILEIGDFTDPEHPDQLVVREFSYDDSSGEVQIITRAHAPDEVDSFQVYEVMPGTSDPGRLLRSGIIIEKNGELVGIDLRIYDWENRELLVLDPATAATQVWQLTENGTGWLLAFQGFYDQDHNPLTPDIQIDVHFQY